MIPVQLIDFENPGNHRYIITNQYAVEALETKIPDILCLINGMPIIVGEAKTPIRPSVSWLDGAHEIHNIYQNTISQLFVPNLLSFATEGKNSSTAWCAARWNSGRPGGWKRHSQAPEQAPGRPALSRPQ